MIDSQTRQVTLARNAIAMTIGGSDPSGGAGLQADLKAFQQLGVYGMSVVTLITVQNTLGVDRIETLSADLIEQQLEAVLHDITPLAIKTGALGTSEIVEAVAKGLGRFKGELIVDPALVSKQGDWLAANEAAGDDVVRAYREHLLPIATLITPNRLEAEKLVGRPLSGLDAMVEAAMELRELGPQYVLIKAGRFDGQRVHIYADPIQVVTIAVDDHPTDQTHGAGCSLSACATAHLTLIDSAANPNDRMRSAINFAITAVHQAISIAPQLGAGKGPIESRILQMGDATSG